MDTSADRPEDDLTTDEIVSIVFRLYMNRGRASGIDTISAFAGVSEQLVSKILPTAIVESQARIRPQSVYRPHGPIEICYEPTAYWMRKQMLAAATNQTEWFETGRKIP